MAPTAPTPRLSVTLDVNIPLERLVLTRLQTLTGRARQSWLRSLLIAGFLLECRAIRAAREWRPEVAPPDIEARRSMRPSVLYSLTPAPGFTGNTDATTSLGEPNSAVIASASTSTKPFAHLRRVIG